jgi:hypothetical protein
VRELALHILDIAENSVSAKADTIKINIVENTHTDKLSLAITDNGIGMDEEMVSAVTDPFVTSRTTRKVGLGIPLLKAAAEACNGGLTITSTKGKGTKISCWFQRSHIDRMPLGDVINTFLMLLVGYPTIHWIFRYEYNDELFEFDDEYFKNELGDLPLSEPSILRFLREHLAEGIEGLKKDRSASKSQAFQTSKSGVQNANS